MRSMTSTRKNRTLNLLLFLLAQTLPTLFSLDQTLTTGTLIGVVDAKKSIPHSHRSQFTLLTDEITDETAWCPPWNPSPKIDPDGFLTESYSRIPGEWEREANIGGRYGPDSWNARSFEKIPVRVRQVPGDGNCLFHSITVALSLVEERRHFDFVGEDGRAAGTARGGRRNIGGMTLRERSEMLRQEAVNILDTSSHSSSSSGNYTKRRRPRRRRPKRLILQGREYLTADELLHVAASQYDLTGEEYCNLMRRDGYWGGGPEIVALCNALRRPIHVYELTDVRPTDRHIGHAADQDDNSYTPTSSSSSRIKKEGGDDSVLIPHLIPVHHDRRWRRTKKAPLPNPEFRLRRMACFGSPRFDNKEPLHILSADCRFPDLRPGKQASSGNHFLTMFPSDSVQNASSLSTRRIGFRVRSGGGGVSGKKKHGSTRKVRREGGEEKEMGCRSRAGRSMKSRRPLKSKMNVKYTKEKDSDRRLSFLAQLQKKLSDTSIYRNRVI